MKTKHTPGPWVANDCVVKAGDCYGPWVADTDVMLKYPPNKQHVSHLEQRANARLIAAAPELLAALKRIATDGDALSTAEIIETARAAIAKGAQ